MKTTPHSFFKKKVIKIPEGFLGSDYHYPLAYGITGELVPSRERVDLALNKVKDKSGGYFLEALWLAEMVEAGQEDKSIYFIGDDRFRSICLGLNQRTNAWALVFGGANDYTELLTHLKKRRFRVFTAGQATEKLTDIEGIETLGNRDTGVVYFGQLLMRYALIYARALAGSGHELTHEIEEHAPGVIFVIGELNEFEHLMVQSLLALGAPLMILGEDKGLVGTVYAGKTISELMDAAWKLPNVRARLVDKAVPDVPIEVGPVFSREKIAPESVGMEISGSDESFVVIKPNSVVEEDELVILGDLEKAGDFGILVELGNPVVDDIVTVGVEGTLLRVVKYLRGVKVNLRDNHVDKFVVTKKAFESGFKLEHLGKVITTELRNRFPEIGPIKVTLMLDHERVSEISSEIKEYVALRKRMIDEATDESVDTFFGCTRCRSFSLGHACTVSPERPAQCGTSPWWVLKAQALLSPDDVYSPSVIVPKGELIDSEKGEYSGVNKSTYDRTGGRVDQVFMYSIFDHPHTACSCFQNVAFYLPEVDGIALVHRGFEGEVPGGLTWRSLGNKVAGHQNTSGYATFATSYVWSPKFFRADGGFDRVVWMTDRLKKIAGESIPEERRGRIATENDVRTLDELKRFIGR